VVFSRWCSLFCRLIHFGCFLCVLGGVLSVVFSRWCSLGGVLSVVFSRWCSLGGVLSLVVSLWWSLFGGLSLVVSLWWSLFVVSPASTNIRINEYKTVMDTTEMKQTGILRTDVLPSLRYWLAVAHRRKAIFHTITKFRPTTENHADRNNHRGEQKSGTQTQSGSILLVVEGWMLADAAREVIMDLRTLSQGTMPLAITEISQLPAGTSPPTYFETNKFTSVFQGIVDTYGVGT
jgi:hypothetical protein